MAELKFVPDLFLEVVELNFFKNTLDKFGFRKALLENTVNYGLIKSNADPTFANGLVQQDVNDLSGNKTIKINPVYAIDSNGQFIYSPNVINQIPVTDDGNWYWLKVRYQYSTQMKGTVSIAANGDLTGSGTDFMSWLRGQPNFPAKIKLTNSVYNTLEYEVLSVTDDTHAILANPATNVGGLAEFAAESNLNYAIVGTFTPGVAIPTNNKYPFHFDGMYYQLVQETANNTKPTPYLLNQEFYIARVKVSGTSVIIQDKRTEYWQSQGKQLVLDIDRTTNPLIGVEAVKWQQITDPSDKNIVDIAWGMRCSNWSVNTSQNLLVLNAANGGIYKTVNDFTDGDFNGWRVYTSNGKYSYVINSVKQGGAINLTLDVLDVDNYSADGGSTFITQTVLVVPNAEEIEILCTATPNTTTGTASPNCNQKFTFPIHTLVGRMDLECYANPTCYYQINYRYKSHKEYGAYYTLPSDTAHGYYTEVSYDVNGVLVPNSAVLYPYTASSTLGFIKLTMSPNAYENFIGEIYKGDLIGVNVITSLSTNVINLVVGESKNYQYVTGNISISEDVFFNLAAPATEGNEFRIHFNCGSLNLNGKNIYIVQGYGGTGGYTSIKQIQVADVWSMLNIDGGICFDCKYTGNTWIMYENYDIGNPFEVKMANVNPSVVFDSNGNGQIKGWFGWQWMNGQNGTTNMQGRTPIGNGAYTESGATTNFNVGDEGGEQNHKLLINETPSHNHNVHDTGHVHQLAGGEDNYITNGGGQHDTMVNKPPDTYQTGEAQANIQEATIGGDAVHNNMQPYTVLIFAQRLY